MRVICQNENGDGSGSCGIVQSVRDTEQIDTNNDGILDDFSVDFDYLARNAVINANAVAMAGQSVKAPTSFTAKYVSPNKISLTITDATNAPAYQVALRSATNDWDSVCTVIGKAPSVIFVGNGTTTRYVSVAAVNTNNVESLFSGEVSISVPATTPATNQVVGVNFMDQLLKTPASPIKGLKILRNNPNPFDESTYVVLKKRG